MSKTSRGQYFLRNSETLPCGNLTPLWESRDKLSFMFLCIFHGLLKLTPSQFLQF